ncbi:hypothetical protein TNCV_1553931 [Trichonephila clavipes]|nr:hypothetical protein TNCV_1553931 [Trichonephila clavipes]
MGNAFSSATAIKTRYRSQLEINAGLRHALTTLDPNIHNLISSPEEELLGLLPLKGQTRGEDIENAVIECMDKHHILLDKLCRFQQMGPKV